MSSREAFEAWAGGNEWPRSVIRSGHGYLLAQTQSAWVAWQAATKAENEACAKVCESPNLGAKYQGDVYASAIRSRTQEG